MIAAWGIAGIFIGLIFGMVVGPTIAAWMIPILDRRVAARWARRAQEVRR